MQKAVTFIVPDEKRQKAAIGLFEDDKSLEKAFESIFPFFNPIPKPKAGDWLADHKESGQSFESYKKREGQLQNRQAKHYLHTAL